LLNLFVFAQKDTIKYMIKPIIVNQFLITSKINILEIDSAILQKNITTQLSTLLQQSTSIFIKSYGNYGISTISFRGTSASHTQVVWNGITLNSPMLGQTDFSLIPTFLTDNIEIAAGINSLNITENALGGVINLNTLPIWNKKKSININSSFASFENYNNSLNFYNSTKKTYYNLRVIYKTGKNDFLYFNNALPDQNWIKLKNANFNQIHIFNQFFYKINNKNILNFNFWFRNTKNQIPPIMSYEGLFRNETQKNKSLFFTTKYVSTITKFNLSISSSMAYEKMNYFLADSLFSFPTNNYYVKNNSFSNELSIYSSASLSYTLNEKSFFQFIAKYNYFEVNIYDSINLNSSGYNHKRNQIIFNFIYNQKITEKFKSNLVITQITNDKKLYQPSVLLAFIKKYNKDFFQNGFSFGSNIKIPTLNDLYWNPGGNPNLKPEKSKSFEFNFNTQNKTDKVLFTNHLDLFISIIDDWILWQPSEFHFWTAQNLNKVLSRGLDYKLMFFYNNIISYKIIFNYSLTLTSNILNNNFNNILNNNQLIYIPKNTANFDLFIFYKKFKFNTNFYYVSKRFTTSSNDLNSHNLPAYYILNFNLSKDFKIKTTNFTISFYYNNVLNLQYQTVLYRPMPGRNFEFILSIYFNK